MCHHDCHWPWAAREEIEGCGRVSHKAYSCSKCRPFASLPPCHLALLIVFPSFVVFLEHSCDLKFEKGLSLASMFQPKRAASMLAAILLLALSAHPRAGNHTRTISQPPTSSLATLAPISEVTTQSAYIQKSLELKLSSKIRPMEKSPISTRLLA